MKYIDLSHDIMSNMPVYPGDMKVSLEHVNELSKDKYNSYSVSTGMHAGTHVDCPMHLLPDAKTIAEYPIDCFAGSGILIDARGQKEIDFKEAYKTKIREGDIVLIYTGMDKSYGEDSYYNDHPVITEELAEFLVSKKIRMLGIDMPSPDFPPFEIHKTLLGNNIFIVENMKNLKQLIGVESFEVFAQPLKIHAEASLVRAFARHD